MPGGLGAVVVRHLERLQLLGGDGRARPLVGLVAVQAPLCNNTRRASAGHGFSGLQHGFSRLQRASSLQLPQTNFSVGVETISLFF